MALRATPLLRALADPLTTYHSRVAQGQLVRDGAQIHALVLLRRLARTLVARQNRLKAAPVHPPSETNSDLNAVAQDHHTQATQLEQWLVAAPRVAAHAPPGALLTGPPGCGKSLAADLFLASLPPGLGFRRHYHHLLLEIYALVQREAARRAREVQALRAQTQLNAEPHSRPTDLFTRLRRVAQPHADRLAAFLRPPVPGRIEAAIAARQARDLARAAHQATTAATTEASELVVSAPPEGGAALASAALGTSTLAEYAAAWLYVSQGSVIVVDELQLLDIASAGLLARVLMRFGDWVVRWWERRIDHHKSCMRKRMSDVVNFNRFLMHSKRIVLRSRWRVNAIFVMNLSMILVTILMSISSSLIRRLRLKPVWAI